jgi:hypothetical protein
MTTLDEYFAALNRLKNNSSIRAVKGSRINKDTVAIEAGRARGSIKKSREMFTELIYEIDKAALDQTKIGSNSLKHKLEKMTAEKERYRTLYHQALNRELMLLEKIAVLEAQPNDTFKIARMSTK